MADITVKAPSGELYDVAPSALTDDLKSQGYTVATPQEVATYDAQKRAEESPLTESLKTAGAAAARSASFGLSDLALTQSGLVAKEDLKALKEANPASDIGGEVAGLFVPGSLLGKGAKVASTLAEKAAANYLTKTGYGLAERAFAKKVLTSVAKEATEGAVYGLQQGITETQLGDPENVGETLAANIGLGMLFGGGVGVAGPIIGKGFEKVSTGLSNVSSKKVMSKVFGVSEDTLDKMIKIRAKGEEVPVMSDLVISYKDKLQSLQDDVLNSKVSLAEAKSKLKEVEDNAWRKYSLDKENAKLSRDEFKKQFNEESQAFIGESKGKLIDAGKAVFKDIADLEEQAVKKSQTITAGLDGQKVKTQSIYDNLVKLETEYNNMGTESGVAAAKSIRNTIEQNPWLQNLNEIGAKRVKKLIVNLDKEINWKDFALADVEKVKNLAKKDIRYALDSELKSQLPDYANAMLPVKEDFQLIQELKGFNTEAKAIRKVFGLDSAVKQELDRPLLDKLANRMGGNKQYLKDVDDFVQRKALTKELPSAKALETAEAEYKALGSKAKEFEIEDAIKATPEAQAVGKFQEQLAVSEAAKKELVGLTPNNIEGVFKRAAKGDAVALEQVKVIENAFNSPLLADSLQKIGTVEAFEKALTNSSFRQLLWSFFGATIGATLGLGGGIAGFVAGRAVGEVSPMLAKQALDKYIDFQSNKFNKLALVNKVAEENSNKLKDGIKSFMQNGAEKTKKGLVYGMIDLANGETSLDTKDTYKKNVTSLQNAGSNPEMLIDRVSDKMGLLNQIAPNVSQVTQQTLFKGLNFLLSKIPPTETATMFNQGFRFPSDLDMAEFNRYARAVNNPLTIIEDLKHGQLTSEAVEVLQNVYPSLYSQIRDQVVDLVHENPNMSYQDRLQISTLLGVPVDDYTDGRFLLEMQNNYKVENEQEKNNELNKINTKPTQKMSDVQRLSTK